MPETKGSEQQSLQAKLLSSGFNAATFLTGHAIMLFARLVTAVRGEWVGVEPVPRIRIYFSNHVSHGDFVLIWTTLPARVRHRTRPVAGADYWLGSKFRRFIGENVFRAVLIERPPKPAADATPTDKSKTTSNLAIERMSEALDAGESLILFPEGTRNTTDEPMLPFRSGLYHVTKANPGVELVPVWIDNLHRVLPKGEIIPVPLACTVTYGEPLIMQEGEEKNAFIARAEAALRQTGKLDETVAA